MDGTDCIVCTVGAGLVCLGVKPASALKSGSRAQSGTPCPKKARMFSGRAAVHKCLLHSLGRIRHLDAQRRYRLLARMYYSGWQASRRVEELLWAQKSCPSSGACTCLQYSAARHGSRNGSPLKVIFLSVWLTSCFVS